MLSCQVIQGWGFYSYMGLISTDFHVHEKHFQRVAKLIKMCENILLKQQIVMMNHVTVRALTHSLHSMQ